MGSYNTIIYAHRGASEYSPENSMESFRQGYDMGADGIEFDVQLTKDGKIVVTHDERIDRVSNGTGFVKDYTLEELRKFDFNNNMQGFSNVKIPTLEEVFEEFQNKDFVFNMELKNSIINYENLEEKVVQMSKKFRIMDRIIFSSFSHKSMIKLRNIEETAKIALLYSWEILDEVEYLAKYNIMYTHPSHKLCSTKEDIEMYHRANQKVNLWTINKGSDMRRLFDFGVDAICTNRPDLAVEIKNDK